MGVDVVLDLDASTAEFRAASGELPPKEQAVSGNKEKSKKIAKIVFFIICLISLG